MNASGFRTFRFCAAVRFGPANGSSYKVRWLETNYHLLYLNNGACPYTRETFKLYKPFLMSEMVFKVVQ